MKLYFSPKKIREIITAVEAGRGHVCPYTGDEWGVPEDNTPGLMLVGDEGIYIIGNEMCSESPMKSGLIAYAGGCNPTKDRNFRDLKELIWGGDDGAEFLSLEDAKALLLRGKKPFVEIAPTTITWGS